MATSRKGDGGIVDGGWCWRLVEKAGGDLRRAGETAGQKRLMIAGLLLARLAGGPKPGTGFGGEDRAGDLRRQDTGDLSARCAAGHWRKVGGDDVRHRMKMAPGRGQWRKRMAAENSVVPVAQAWRQRNERASVQTGRVAPRPFGWSGGVGATVGLLPRLGAPNLCGWRRCPTATGDVDGWRTWRN
jgi:hypothetical protein